MRGLFLEAGEARFRSDLPEPEPGPGEVLIDVLRAGVCATDLALRRGYMDFVGVPGHEFVGRARSGAWAGHRVVGDINAACGACPTCRAGDPHHCPGRTVLGILGRSGAFAERLCLPEENLLPVPAGVSDEAASFVEPLAAALEICEQVMVPAGLPCLVVGDGRLGLLCAWALHLHGAQVRVQGRHPERAGLLPEGTAIEARVAARFPLVVEATGRAELLPEVLASVQPRGTLILKTTSERATSLDLSRVVVDEISLIGSRCGPFDKALDVLAEGRIPVERWVAARYPLDEAVQALEHAARRGTMKVLLEV